MLRLATKLGFLSNKCVRHLDISCTQISLLGEAALSFTAPLQLGPQSDPEQRAWSEQLANLLPETRGCALHVTLSDRLTRSWIVDRPAGLRSPKEITALANWQLQAIYGDSAADAAAWHICLDTQPFADAWPAIAIPQWLIDRITATASERGYRLASIQPRFVRSLNAHPGARRHWPKPAMATVHLLDCEDSISLGIESGGQWRSLRTHPPIAALGIEQATLIRRECRSAGVPVETSRINALHWPPGQTFGL